MGADQCGGRSVWFRSVWGQTSDRSDQCGGRSLWGLIRGVLISVLVRQVSGQISVEGGGISVQGQISVGEI